MTIFIPCHSTPALNPSLSSARNKSDISIFFYYLKQTLLLLLFHNEPNKEHRLDRFTRNFITVRTGSFVPAKGKEKRLLTNVSFILIKFRSLTCSSQLLVRTQDGDSMVTTSTAN